MILFVIQKAPIGSFEKIRLLIAIISIGCLDAQEVLVESLPRE